MIAGGKLTTYRVMAKDAIDVAVPDARDCITDRIPLVGADGFLARSNQRALLARRAGISVGRVDHLLGRYGGLHRRRAGPPGRASRLAEPLEGADDFLAAEIVYAVTHEGARHLDDVLTRRTRISIETFDRGIHAAGPAARLMAGELGWDDARIGRGGRPLPASCRGRAAEPDDAHRPGGRRGEGERSRHRLSSRCQPWRGRW